MNIFIRLASVMLVLFSLFGCQAYTQTPKPATYKYDTQQKMQSAEHWNILAEDVASQIKKNLAKIGLLSHPIYVRPGCGAPYLPCRPHTETPFEEGFYDLLLTHLVRKGMNVSTERESSLVIGNKVQVLYHNAGRISRTSKPGLITAAAALASGLGWVIRDASEKSAAWGLAGFTGAAFYDYVSGMFTRDMPHSEVIITTSIRDYDRYLIRKTDIYYINDLDFWHYQSPSPTRMIEITGS